ncbi:MAG: FkbM family methyltransferase [Zoogloeaceae bacterium]|nr:FkbM family methyltransferase [Zoogloeaceae bacterium]
MTLNLKMLPNRLMNQFSEVFHRCCASIGKAPPSGLKHLARERFVANKGNSRLFHFRPSSRGDRGVVRQVLRNLDYDIERWQHGRALRDYYINIKSTQRPLIIDAGANIGAASVYYKMLYPEAKVIAIEPERHNVQLLRLNTHDLEVEVLEAALTDRPRKIYLQDVGHSDWGFQVGDTGSYTVQSVTMQDILSHQGDRATPLIAKLDVEGSEAQIFSGNSDWIALFPLIVIELHDWMLPGKSVSRSFYRHILELDFDIVTRGENTFCFNNKILRSFYH